MEFERAAALRDRIRGLTHVQGTGIINPASIEDADIIAIHQAADQSCVQVFFIRGGRNNGNRAFFPANAKRRGGGRGAGGLHRPVLRRQAAPAAGAAATSAVAEPALIAEALSLKADRKVELLGAAVRGEKRAVVEHAATNAREALERRLAEGAGQAKLLEGVATLFGLEAPPERIETYDNSHIMGTNAYGVMVVAGVRGLHQAGLPQIFDPRPDRARETISR